MDSARYFSEKVAIFSNLMDDDQNADISRDYRHKK